MKDQCFIIYPGKLTEVENFRIGCIGRMSSEMVRAVIAAAKHALSELDVTSEAPPSEAADSRMVLTA